MVISASRFLHVATILVGCAAFVAGVSKYDMSNGDLARLVYIYIVTPTFIVYLSKCHEEIFTQWYDWVILISEIVSVSLKSYGAVHGMPKSDAGIYILVIQSPLIALVIAGTAFHTKFWSQLLGQLIGTTTSHFWIYSLCNNPAMNSRLHKISNGFLWHLDSCISTTYLIRIRGSNIVYPCVVSMGFFHFAVGFVIPCAVKYMLESHERARYLTLRSPFSEHNVIQSLLLGNIKSAFGVAAICLIGPWFLVSHFLSYYQPGQCTAA